MRKSLVPMVELLETRDLLATMIWAPGFWTGSVNQNWGDRLNWTNQSTQLPPAQAPGANDNVIVGVSSLHLDANRQVNSLIVDPLQNPQNLIIYMHEWQLTVVNNNITADTFTFNGGNFLFDHPDGELVLDGLVGAKWKDDASFLGITAEEPVTGTVWLKGGTFMSVMGPGVKKSEALIVIGSITDQATTVLEVATNTVGSMALGDLGSILVSSQGSLVFNESGTFAVTSTGADNTIDVYGRLSQNWIGETTLEVSVTLQAETSELYVNKGALVVNDPNDLASVIQMHGHTTLAPGTTFSVLDGFWMYDGAFRLQGLSTAGDRDVMTTYGDFYFDCGFVGFVHPDPMASVGIVWDSNGRIVFGDESILYMTISGQANCCDQISSDAATLGGQLFLASGIVPVAESNSVTLISTNDLYGVFSSMSYNAQPLENNFTHAFVNGDFILTEIGEG